MNGDIFNLINEKLYLLTKYEYEYIFALYIDGN